MQQPSEKPKVDHGNKIVKDFLVKNPSEQLNFLKSANWLILIELHKYCPRVVLEHIESDPTILLSYPSYSGYTNDQKLQMLTILLCFHQKKSGIFIEQSPIYKLVVNLIEPNLKNFTWFLIISSDRAFFNEFFVKRGKIFIPNEMNVTNLLVGDLKKRPWILYAMQEINLFQIIPVYKDYFEETFQNCGKLDVFKSEDESETLKYFNELVNIGKKKHGYLTIFHYILNGADEHFKEVYQRTQGITTQDYEPLSKNKDFFIQVISSENSSLHNLLNHPMLYNAIVAIGTRDYNLKNFLDFLKAGASLWFLGRIAITNTVVTEILVDKTLVINKATLQLVNRNLIKSLCKEPMKFDLINIKEFLKFLFKQNLREDMLALLKVVQCPSEELYELYLELIQYCLHADKNTQELVNAIVACYPLHNLRMLLQAQAYLDEGEYEKAFDKLNQCFQVNEFSANLKEHISITIVNLLLAGNVSLVLSKDITYVPFSNPEPQASLCPSAAELFKKGLQAYEYILSPTTQDGITLKNRVVNFMFGNDRLEDNQPISENDIYTKLREAGKLTEVLNYYKVKNVNLYHHIIGLMQETVFNEYRLIEKLAAKVEDLHKDNQTLRDKSSALERRQSALENEVALLSKQLQELFKKSANKDREETQSGFVKTMGL